MSLTARIAALAAPLPRLESFQRYLFIGPHPDDIEVGAGATAAKLCAMGKEVSFLICTDGRFGLGNAPAGTTPEQLAELRRRESVTAAAVLGVTEGRFLVCSVANGRFIGGGIPICPAADPSDGLLDLVLVRHVPRRRIPLYLPGLMMGRDLNFRITTHRRVRSVTFEGEKLRVNIDGEIRTMDGAEFRIRPGSLRLIRPPAERN